MRSMGKVRKNKAKRSSSKAKKQGGGFWRTIAWVFGKSLKWSTVAAIWGVIVFALAATWYATDLPDVSEAFNATRAPTVTVLAADGSELAVLGDVYGRAAGLDELPPRLVDAVLATEDRRFYSHFGLDIIGLTRAMVANIKAKRIVQGGSTITQQVAKNLFLTPARTIKRKFQELLLALWLEQNFSKDQILTIYLNRVYLGAGTYGVDAAAQKYFARPAAGLSTYQAAMLAGLLKAPSRYNPLAHPDRARARTGQVLKNMVAAGYLSAAEATSVGKEKAAGNNGLRRLATAPGSRFGRHFAAWVMEQVSGYVNLGDRDLIVQTTLSPKLQQQAQNSLARMLGKQAAAGRAAAGRAAAGRAAAEVALVAMTPAGAVRAMVGGRDYAKSQFNRATQARRQPGSAFKPFVYLAGLEAGLRPDSVLVDAPLRIGNWQPRNFSKIHRGRVTLSQAMALSINTIAVQVAEQARRDRVITVARRLGLSGNFRLTPSLALGVAEVSLLELTAAYGPFSNGGDGVWPYGIEEIRDRAGKVLYRAGKVLYRRAGSGPGHVVAADHVAAMNAMLSGVVSGGTGRAADIGRPQAGKTGTSQNYRDAWFIGYTADLIAGVWMGNDNGGPMNKVTGGGAPARLWRNFMARAHQGLAVKALPGGSLQPMQDPAGPSQDGEGFWDKFFAKL